MAINEPNIQPGPLPSATTIEELPRHLRMYRVTDQELTTLASVKSGLYLGFLGVSLGCLVAFWIVLKTVSSLSERDYTTFFALTFLSGFLSLFCGVMTIPEILSSRRLVTAIRGTASGDE
jgi:apolipoprotein N-acyltransferase